jgi:tetratricopeptide (TPR) repeat protein
MELSGLPAQREEIALPAAKAPGFQAVPSGVPRPASALPAGGSSSAAPRPSFAAEPLFDELDFKSVMPARPSAHLPAVPGQAAGLPAVAKGRAAGNLPAASVQNLPATSSPNLPSASSGNLPAASTGGLPAPGGTLTSNSLPSSALSLPQAGGAGLPETAGSLPVPGDGFPSLSDGPAPPEVSSGSLPANTLEDFGDAMGTGGEEVDPFALGTSSDDPFAGSADPFADPPSDAFAASPGGSGAFRTAATGDPFAPAGTVVYPNTSGQVPEGSEFGAATDHDIAHRSAFDTGHSQAPSFGTEADPFAGAPGHGVDPFGGGQERSAFDTAAGESAFGEASSDNDPFTGAGSSAFDTAAGIGSLGSMAVPAGLSQAPPAAEGEERPKRQGGVDYGEVDLGGGDSDSVFGSAPAADDGMEFGGVPQEEKSTASAAANTLTGSSDLLHARMAIGAMPEIETDRQRRRKRRVRVAVAVTFVVLVAGGALTLIPSAGPFGAFYIMDRINLGRHQQLLAQTIRTVNDVRGLDVFKEVEPMVDAAVRSAEQVPRFRALSAYAAFVRYWAALRFGPLPEVEARAKVMINELEQIQSVDKLWLAQAAQAIVENNLARARELLQFGKDTDSDAESLRGELLLRSREYEKAEQVWQRLFDGAHTAQAAYGLARAVLARGDDKRALELANKTVELSPEHLDSRILLARLFWNKSEESKALEALKFIVDRSDVASPGVLVASQTALGNIHLARGRYSQAESAYSEALKINARAAEALRGLGDTLYAAGRFAESLARFEAALEIEPDNLTAAVGVGKAKFSLERLEEAKAHLAKLYEAHTNDMNVAYWFGRVEEGLGNKESARTAYTKSIEAGGQRPESVKAYIALGSLQSQLGDVEGANATLASAQAKLPESPELHKAMGTLALDHGRFEAALEEFGKALTLDSHDIEARFLMGTTKRRMRAFEDALAIFDEVGKIDPSYPGFALERGLLFEEWGRIDQALKEYEAALAKAPNDPDVMLRVGCARVAAGYGGPAEEILRKVQSMRTQPAEASHCLGRALMLKDDLAEAIRLLQRAVDIAPRRAEYHLYLGWAFNEHGKLSDADTELKKALDLDQGLADAYWQRGVLRSKQSAVKLAIEDLMYALKLRPSRVEAHAQLATVYAAMGQEQKALAEWSIATKGRPNEMVWHFRYGKLLAENLRTTEAVNELDIAIAAAQKLNVPPRWLAEAHLYMARGIGPNQRAVEHWKAYWDQAPSDSPYRDEARQALKSLGHPVRE